MGGGGAGGEGGEGEGAAAKGLRDLQRRYDMQRRGEDPTGRRNSEWGPGERG
jgi:hypothetical protein